MKYSEESAENLKRHCPYLVRRDTEEFIMFEDESVFRKPRLKK